MPLTANPTIQAVVAQFNDSIDRPPIGDWKSRRDYLASTYTALKQMSPAYPGISIRNFSTTVLDGHRVLLRWYAIEGVKPPGSAVLFIHGGGMISGSAADYDPIIKPIVDQTEVPILSVDYRLAPEHRAPTQTEDAYAGLMYLVENATQLGVDPRRIGIMGDSAGAGIAAALSHLVKRKQKPFVKKQILVYPMLDDRTQSADEDLEPHLFWTVDDNITGWGALLGDRMGDPSVAPVDAAGRATLDDVRGLPPAYIEVGQLDLFAGECLAYASLLNRAGVDVEFHLTPGMCHSWDKLIPDDEESQMIVAHRVAAVKSL